MTPKEYALVSLQYGEEQKSIRAQFASPDKKITQKYSFFPSFFLPKKEVFRELLENEKEKHQIIQRENSYQLTAGTWSGLKKIGNNLYRQTHYYPSMIEPERQFLLLQKWKYFQSFDENQKPLTQNFQNTLIPYFCETIHETITQMSEHNPKLSKKIREQIILSHELCIPLTKTEFTQEEQLEILLDNFMFQEGQYVPKEKTKKIELSHFSIGERKKIAENVWNSPLSEEGKCECCKPKNPLEKNVHPSSLIRATATQDGVYIHTSNPVISSEYHQKNQNKEKREKRKKEFGLHQIPIGPLQRGEKIYIPLQEALTEQENGTISIQFEEEKAMWNCNQKKFILQKMNQSIQKQIQKHTLQQNEYTQPYLIKHGLAYTIMVQKDPIIQLSQNAQTITTQWHNQLPLHILQGKTKWTDGNPIPLSAHS